MTIMTERPVAYASVSDAPNILDRAAVAALLGLAVSTVDEYRIRYRDTDAPFPAPDGYFGRSPYWLESRAEELRAWQANRPRPGRPRRRR